MIRSIYALVFILLSINLFSQGRIIKSSAGDEIKIRSRDGKIVLENNSINSFSLELWKNDKKIHTVLLSPGTLFLDEYSFFQRSFIASKNSFYFESKRKDLKKYFLRITYDEESYVNDMKIIKNERFRQQSKKNLTPYINTIIRFLGASDLLFYKSLAKIAISNKKPSEKEQDLLNAFIKKGFVSSFDNPLAKIIVAGYLDVYSQPDGVPRETEISEFMHYCSKKLLISKPKDYYIEEFNFKFYPHSTLTIGFGYPISNSFYSYKGIKYPNRNEGPPNSFQSFIESKYPTISIELRNSILMRQKNSYNGRFSFVYGAFYEQGPIFYNQDSLGYFSEGEGITHRKAGLELGFGNRLIGSSSLFGIEAQFTGGISKVFEADVKYSGRKPSEDFSIQNFDNGFYSFVGKGKLLADLDYLILAFEFKFEVDLNDESFGKNFFLGGKNILITIPIQRKLKLD